MITILEMPASKVVFIIIFAVVTISGIAQDSQEDPCLNIRGIAELDLKPLSGAVATLYEGSHQVNSIQTGANGRFSFRLDANKEYTIEVSKEGYVSKRISFNTTMPDEEEGTWTNEFSIGLVKYCDGVNYSVLNEPVDIIEFDSRRREFLSNRNYVDNMRPRIEKVLIDYEECILDKYEESIRNADQFYARKDFQEAIKEYEDAISVYPDENYPRKKISEIQALIKKDQMQNDAYNKAIDDADALFKQQNYSDAIALYRKAATIKPQNDYAVNKISESETAYAGQQAELKEQRAKEDAYNQALINAGTAYTQRDYETAKKYYEVAQEIKPSETLPQNRLVEIQDLLEKKAKEEAKVQEIENAYREAITRAESLLKNKDYKGAKELYGTAITIKPSEAYPRTKIAEIDHAEEAEARAEENERRAALEREYQTILSEADQLFNAKDYEGAKTIYNKALSFKPDESYPRQRIKAIELSVAEEKAAIHKSIEDDYKAAIGAANTAISQKNYEQARTCLQVALELKPDDAYASGKLSELNLLVAEQEEALKTQQLKDEQYNQFIAEGNLQMEDKAYNMAKAQYNKALQIKPDDSYAKQKLAEISNIRSAELASLKRNEDEAYSAAMAAGADAVLQKNYPEAKDAFMNALSIRPGDVSATLKLNETERIILEEQNRLAEEAQRKKDYDLVLARGDELFSEKDYPAALTAFEKALAIFPAEAYPRQKLEEIGNIFVERDEMLRKQQAVENAFQMAINGADKYYRAKDYQSALDEYNRALSIKPDESYPKSQIIDVERLIQEQEKAKADAIARTDTYASAINLANTLYERKEYGEARVNYIIALQQIPGDKYATRQIETIEHLLAEQEKQKLAEQDRKRKYDETIALADNEFDAGSYKQAQDNYRKALGIEPNSTYAKQRIAKIDEISRILSRSSARSQENEEGQSGLILNAPLRDISFSSKIDRDDYFSELKQKYSSGITLEIYKEKYKETLRYIVIRNDVAQEFRQIRFLTFGGEEFSVNGKPITRLYFQSQIKQREGEQFKEIVMQ